MKEQIEESRIWYVYSKIASIYYEPSGHEMTPPTMDLLVKITGLDRKVIRSCCQELARRGVLFLKGYGFTSAVYGETDCGEECLYDGGVSIGKMYTPAHDLPDDRNGHMAEALNMIVGEKYCEYWRLEDRKRNKCVDGGEEEAEN